MGLLRGLLSLPVSGPVHATVWLARKLHETAETETNDPAHIKRSLANLEAALEAGEIDENEYDEAEEQLLRRLAQAGSIAG
ncbi:MAG: gas vesicle protein GvpG [Pseudomonadota bacterium]